MGVSIDTSELRTLAADLGRVPDRALGDVRATTQRAALNIKRQLQDEAAGSRHFSRMPASISYETWEDAHGVGADIGPEIGRQQGSLGFIAYEGTATSGPRFPDPAGAMEAEADAWERYLADAVAGDML